MTIEEVHILMIKRYKEIDWKEFNIRGDFL